MSLGQWILWGTCVGLLAALAVLARGPVRLLFAAGVVADVVVRLGQVFVLEGAPKPFAGLARGVYGVEVGLVALWPFGCCALVWWVFLGPQKAEGPDRSEPSSRGVGSAPPGPHAEGVGFGNDREQLGTPRRSPTSPLRGPRSTGPESTAGPLAVKVTLAAWLAFSAAMALWFPLPRGMTAKVLLAVHVGMVALSALPMMLGWSRRRERPAVVASWLFAGQTAVALVGPFVREPWEPGGWDVARVGYVTLFLLLLAQYAAWLRPRR